MLAASSPAIAQSDPISEIEIDQNEGSDEGNSRIGLLGLLGLAGLLGLRRREPDIHVDARGDTRG
jgi:MYXO-CTERM domain-containing protein